LSAFFENLKTIANGRQSCQKAEKTTIRAEGIHSGAGEGRRSPLSVSSAIILGFGRTARKADPRLNARMVAESCGDNTTNRIPVADVEREVAPHGPP
jgi:hypothetical protein